MQSMIPMGNRQKIEELYVKIQNRAPNAVKMTCSSSGKIEEVFKFFQDDTQQEWYSTLDLLLEDSDYLLEQINCVLSGEMRSPSREVEETPQRVTQPIPGAHTQMGYSIPMYYNAPQAYYQYQPQPTTYYTVNPMYGTYRPM